MQMQLQAQCTPKFPLLETRRRYGICRVAITQRSSQYPGSLPAAGPETWPIFEKSSILFSASRTRNEALADALPLANCRPLATVNPKNGPALTNKFKLYTRGEWVNCATLSSDRILRHVNI